MTGISVRAPGMSSFGGIQFFSVVGDILYFIIYHKIQTYLEDYSKKQEIRERVWDCLNLKNPLFDM